MNKILVLRYAPEYWCDVKGFQNYEVSNLGNIRNKKTGRELKPKNHRDGYQSINLCHKGNQRTLKIHRLVAQAFYGESQLPVDHVNGVKHDNNLANLRYISSSENSRKSNLGHTRSRGEQHGQAKLTESCVREIKRLLKLGRYTQKQIGEMFGVHANSISNIKVGKNWKHIV